MRDVQGSRAGMHPLEWIDTVSTSSRWRRGERGGCSGSGGCRMAGLRGSGHWPPLRKGGKVSTHAVAGDHPCRQHESEFTETHVAHFFPA